MNHHVEIESGIQPREFARALKRLPSVLHADENSMTLVTYDVERDWLRIESKRHLISLSILEAATQARLELSYSPISDQLSIEFDGGCHIISTAAVCLKVVITSGAEDKDARQVREALAGRIKPDKVGAFLVMRDPLGQPLRGKRRG